MATTIPVIIKTAKPDGGGQPPALKWQYRPFPNFEPSAGGPIEPRGF